MPEVKFERVVSFSSEDPRHRADNLIAADAGAGRKWKAAEAGEKQLSVVLQAPTPVRIRSIDLGNDGSAFIEVLVGRSEQRQEQGESAFRTILPASSFMSPLESRNEQNLSRVRIFPEEKLVAGVANQKWDRVKLVCTQPFNPRLKYGVTFVKVHSEDSPPEVSGGGGRGSSDNPQRNGQLPTKAAASPEANFFGLKVREKNDEDGEERPKVGGLFARMKKAEQPNKLPSSVAAELRSEATLASMAIKAAFTEEERARAAEKRRLEDESAGRKPPAKKRQKVAKDVGEKVKVNLPRRDVLPGEPLPGPSSAERPSPPRTATKVMPPQKQDKANKQVQVEEKVPKKTVREEPKAAAVRPRRTAPFFQLFEGVKLVISGYQNPLRAEIRGKAVDMGAQYRGDWDPSCTHLVCAFRNTPKFREVAAQGGKIVAKEWVELSYKDRVRYPWRRYCLDPKHSSNDNDDDDEEVWAETAGAGNHGSGTPEVSDPGSNHAIPVRPPESENKHPADRMMEQVAEIGSRRTGSQVGEPGHQTEAVKQLSNTSTKANDEAESAYDAETDVDEDDHQDVPPSAPAKPSSAKSESFYDAETDIDEDVDLKESPAKPPVKSESVYDAETDIDEDVDLQEAPAKPLVKSETFHDAETDVDEDVDLQETPAKPPVKSESVYDAETDVDEDVDLQEASPSKSAKPAVKLQSTDRCFHNLRLTLYGPFEDQAERRQLEEEIRSAGGTVERRFSPSKTDYLVTHVVEDQNTVKALGLDSALKIVHPRFIRDCIRAKRLLSTPRRKDPVLG